MFCDGDRLDSEEENDEKKLRNLPKFVTENRYIWKNLKDLVSMKDMGSVLQLGE